MIPVTGPDSPHFGRHQNDLFAMASPMTADEMRFTMWRHIENGAVCRVIDCPPDKELWWYKNLDADYNVAFCREYIGEILEPYDSMRQGWPSDLEKQN